MQVNVDLLVKKIEDCNMSMDNFARAIGMNPSTFYRQKSKGFLSMSIGQMHSTVDVLILPIEEAKNIFLFENSH